jgi:nitroreductase
MDAFEAISVRRSCRAYAQEPLTPGELGEVSGLAAGSRLLRPDLGMRTWVVPGEKVAAISGGLVAAYGEVKAPHFIVVTTEASEGGHENVGFALEPVVLELVARGYGTCWIGGQARRDLVDRVVDAPAGHELSVVIAVGRPAVPGGHLREPGTGDRRPLADLMVGNPGRFAPLLEAVRSAPSAANSQPWRFMPEGDALHVLRVSRHAFPLRLAGEHLLRMNRVDCGIALAHIALAAQHDGRTVKFERAHVTPPHGLSYVATAVLG